MNTGALFVVSFKVLIHPLVEDILKYVTVFLLSMIKFVGGPLFGIKTGISVLKTALFTSLGMMSSVALFTTFLGDRFHGWMMRLFNKNPRLFTKNNRKKVKMWRLYGLKGVAFLTPLIFSPIGGTMLANSFGESKKRIILYMFVSSVFWALTMSFVFWFLGHASQYWTVDIKTFLAPLSSN